MFKITDEERLSSFDNAEGIKDIYFKNERLGENPRL